MKYKLGEIATFSQGKQVDLKEQYSENKGNLKRFIRIVDYTNTNEPKRFVEDYGKRYYADKEDLVMIRYGSQTAGKVVMGKSGIIANNMFKINLNNEIVSNRYMYYYLFQKNIFNYLRGAQSSSTMPAINFTLLNNFVVNLPELSIQNKVVKILNDIDRKIELNNKINDSLQKLIENTYKERFINNVEYSLQKMDKLVEKTIGGDWGKEKLTDNYNSEVVCIRGADITEIDNGNKGKAPNRFILEKNLNLKQLHGEEIIIEISGGSPIQSTGRCAYITYELEKTFDKPLICTNFCRAIKLKQNKYLPSFYMNLKYLYSKDIMFLYENGTTGIKNLDLTSLLENEDINLVNDKITKEFNELFYTVNSKIIKNSEKNRTLVELRDTLLPKLMNGEIDLDKIEV